MEARPGAMEPHPGAIVAHHGAMEVHPRDVHGLAGTMEAHPGATEAQNVHSSKLSVAQNIRSSEYL
jgi:hypothetical protein